MKTSIYIDGFNFYYGTVKDTPYKWVDFKSLFQKILKPHHTITSIKYFTALVSSTPEDPDKTNRQKTFLRALRTHIRELEVFYGMFLSHEVPAPLARPTNTNKFVRVIKTEEKGSDVNLAVHLLNDAWLNTYDCAVVVSNDSDLAEAMRLVKDYHPEKLMGVFTPGERKTSKQLGAHANFVRSIRLGAVKSSQLPSPIPGTKIHKPDAWSCK